MAEIGVPELVKRLDAIIRLPVTSPCLSRSTRAHCASRSDCWMLRAWRRRKSLALLADLPNR